MGQSAGVSRGIDTMGFRAEEPGEAILGRQYIQKRGFLRFSPSRLLEQGALEQGGKEPSLRRSIQGSPITGIT